MQHIEPQNNEIASHDADTPTDIEPTTKAADEQRLRELDEQLSGLAKKTLMLVLEAGEILTRLKEDTPHGTWEKYVKNDLGIHPRSASNYMRIYRESRSIDTIGKFIDPETVSDFGVREALDYLAEQKKASTSQDGDVPRQRKKGSSPASHPDRTIALADGSKLSMKKIGWREGLIPETALEHCLKELAQDDKSPAENRAIARKQRFVAEIAASINRCSGKAKPEAALKIAQAALEAVNTMISEPNGLPQQG